MMESQSRKEFESELIERFGSLVRMPLLKPERSPLPDSVRSIIEEGINLYKLHTNKHGRLESTKGTYAKEWVKWEKQMRDILLGNADYLNSIQLAQKDLKVGDFVKDKSMESCIQKAYLTLAHKRSHGVTAVANYGSFIHQKVPVDAAALLSEKLAALEAEPGSVEGEKVNSKNQWPHVTLRTEGVIAKDANTLLQLLSRGKAIRIDINSPVTITGTLEFF